MCIRDRNMTVYEYGSDIFIIDCGMTFPDAEMPGVDIVIPDFSYVVKNADRVKGLVITQDVYKRQVSGDQSQS